MLGKVNHLIAENKYLRQTQQSFRKVMRETEQILEDLPDGKDLLARLKSVQKAQSKQYN